MKPRPGNAMPEPRKPDRIAQFPKQRLQVALSGTQTRTAETLPETEGSGFLSLKRGIIYKPSV